MSRANPFLLLDEAPFAIRDRAFEEKYGCDLSQTLEKARQIKEEGGLFEPYFFYVVSFMQEQPLAH